MSDAATHGRFGAGRAFRSATTILARDAPQLLLLAALVVGLPEAVMAYATARFTDDLASGTTWIALTLIVLVSMLSTVALQAIVARRVQDDLIGDRSRPDQARFGGLGGVVALAALGLATSLAIMAGLVLLIIPGIILSLAWFVAVPAMVTERLGVMAAMGRSNRLTGEARGAIFGLAVAVGLVMLLLTWLTELAIGAIGNTVAAAIIDAALQTLIGLGNAILAVAVYYELRRSQEGTLAESLDAIFA